MTGMSWKIHIKVFIWPVIVMYFIRLKKKSILLMKVSILVSIKRQKKKSSVLYRNKNSVITHHYFLSLLSGGSGYLIGYLCFRAFEFGFSSITILFHLFCLFVFFWLCFVDTRLVGLGFWLEWRFVCDNNSQWLSLLFCLLCCCLWF